MSGYLSDRDVDRKVYTQMFQRLMLIFLSLSLFLLSVCVCAYLQFYLPDEHKLAEAFRELKKA